jgi:transposase
MGDLAWANFKVELNLQVRRFRCFNPECKRKIFCERLEGLAKAYAQRTLRQAEQLTNIAFALGGRAGSRLAEKLGLSRSSFHTLLRLISKSELGARPTPKLLGVDDFAFKKGHTYGTILLNLTTHQVVELLADREADTFANWLGEHPGVEIISRDRAGAYAEGGKRGAPQALQVADRFHLYLNLTEAVEASLRRQEKWLSEVLLEVGGEDLPTPLSSLEQTGTKLGPLEEAKSQEAPTPKLATPKSKNERAIPKPASRGEVARQARQALRQDRYEQMAELANQGYSINAIALHLGFDRRTVEKWLKAGQPLAPSTRQRPWLKLGPYQPYLQQRWHSGFQNVKLLIAEIEAQGYQGGTTMVYDYLRKLRPKLEKLSRHPHYQGAAQRAAAPVQKGIKVRKATWLLMKDWEKLASKERLTLQILCEKNEEIARVYQVVVKFKEMFREQKLEAWGEWHEQVKSAQIGELASFAAGLRRDEKAVKAAIISQVSNGPTEGAINRLKNIKRSMFGRAKFTMLRARVLKAA